MVFQGSFMGRPNPRSILLADVQMEVDRRHVLVAAVRYFPHGQSSGVHHVPFRAPLHVPTGHGSKNTFMSGNSLCELGSEVQIRL